MNRTETVIEELKAMIASGRFVPGQKLPTEDELTAELNVSRSLLREAVRALTFARILRTRQGDGTYVTTLEPGLLFESLNSMIDLVDGETVLELYQARRIFEPAAAALAAARMNDERLDELEAYIEAMAGANDPDEFIDADLAFHEALVAAADNAVFSAINRLLATRAARSRLWRARQGVNATTNAVVVHRAILTALRNRDAELVRALCTSHIADGEHWFRAALVAGSS